MAVRALRRRRARRRRRCGCWPSASRCSAACPRWCWLIRMGCLKGGVVANVVIPTPDYVRFATQYGFRPDFCEGGDPSRRGSSRTWSATPSRTWSCRPGPDVERLEEANAAAIRGWCAEVNGQTALRDLRGAGRAAGQRGTSLLRQLPSLRARIGQVDVAHGRPSSSTHADRDEPATRCPSAVRSATSVEVMAVDGRIKVLGRRTRSVADHAVDSPRARRRSCDDHYGGAPARQAAAQGPPDADARPRRRSALAGPGRRNVPEGRGGCRGHQAAASNLRSSRVSKRRYEAVGSLVAAAEYARWCSGAGAPDVRSILAAGTGAPQPTAPGEALLVPLPIVPTRPLSAYAIETGVMTAAAPQPLAADLTAGLRRLKLVLECAGSPRTVAQPAKTQRWAHRRNFCAPSIEAEIASRDASNARARLKAANFPVAQNDSTNSRCPPVSSIPRATFDYLGLAGMGARPAENARRWSAQPGPARAIMLGRALGRAADRSRPSGPLLRSGRAGRRPLPRSRPTTSVGQGHRVHPARRARDRRRARADAAPIAPAPRTVIID